MDHIFVVNSTGTVAAAWSVAPKCQPFIQSSIGFHFLSHKVLENLVGRIRVHRFWFVHWTLSFRGPGGPGPGGPGGPGGLEVLQKTRTVQGS